MILYRKFKDRIERNSFAGTGRLYIGGGGGGAKGMFYTKCRFCRDFDYSFLFLLCFIKSVSVIGKLQIGNCSSFYAIQ